MGYDGHILLTDISTPSSASVCSKDRGAEFKIGCDHFDTLLNEYRAPEVILDWDSTPLADSWSFGSVLYFMVLGQVHVSDRGKTFSDPCSHSTRS